MLLLCPFFEFFGLKMMKKGLAFDENIQVSFPVIFFGSKICQILVISHIWTIGCFILLIFVLLIIENRKKSIGFYIFFIILAAIETTKGQSS